MSKITGLVKVKKISSIRTGRGSGGARFGVLVMVLRQIKKKPAKQR